MSSEGDYRRFRHSSRCLAYQCSGGYVCHVAEVVGARCETRYAFLVSALIRIALSVWPALASISPSTPSHRLPLLRCSDVSKNRPPQSVRSSPNNCLLPRRLGLSRYAHCAFPRAVLADRVASAMTMRRSRLPLGLPYPTFQYVSNAVTSISLGKAIVLVLPLPHLASFSASCVSLPPLRTSAFHSFHQSTITIWLQ